MNELLRFLEFLFTEGTVRLRTRPVLTPAARPQLERLLRDAYTEHALSVAGPEPTFDFDTAERAALLLADACWFLLSHDEPPEEVERRLTWEPETLTPGQLLSADLCLHYLPEVHRRARSLDAADTLTGAVTRLLRIWPLCGVLANLNEPPLRDLHFAGSSGLQLLYAERLSPAPDLAWIPREGPTREWIELVFHRKGQTLQRPLALSSADKESL